MSFSSQKISLYMCWLCLMVILCINTQHCQGMAKLCGRNLADTLDLICENGFARKTRKSIEPIDYYLEGEEDTPSLIQDFPFFSKVPTNALAKTRRRRHGVYDECCRKACTLSELRAYCL